MKKLLITPLLLLFCLNGSSQGSPVTAQNWDFAVRANHGNSINIEKLNQVKSLSDLMPDYAASWIDKYLSVEISVTSGGKTISSRSKNEVLSTEQIKLLSTADLSTDVIINSTYLRKNAISGEPEENKMKYRSTVVPDTEAEYTGGQEQLIQYLKENAINKIEEENSKRTVQALVKFVINEQGEITDVQVSKTSDYPNIDKLLLETITNMPKWKPAQNAKGEKVKQGFEFSLNSPNVGGC